MKVVTVTLNPCIDETLTVERVMPDTKLRVEEVQRYPGGGGINVARTVHELGGDVRALWSMGGPTGRRLAELLDAEGLAHEPVRIAAETRENVIVLERATGHHLRFGVPGPELTLAERRCWCTYLRHPQAEWIVLSGSLPRGVPEDAYGELVRGMADDARFVVDAKGAVLRAALEAGAYLVKPNRRELAQLVGHDLEDPEAVAQAARELRDAHPVELIVVSLGAEGALLCGPGGVEHVPAPQVELASPIGAGDSLVGGLVHALAQERSPLEALRLGVAAGAAAVSTPGTGLATRALTEELLGRLVGGAS